MKHFYRPFVSAYMDVCEAFETLFPECLSKVLLVSSLVGVFSCSVHVGVRLPLGTRRCCRL